MSESLVAAVEPTPIPGPGWLFHVLLVFTFILHVVFMNLSLGGTIIAAVAQFASGRGARGARAVLARRLMGVNTYGISLAVTAGIAPLLFVQVLYQQYFYSATILIAWVWLLFLVMLMFGYYSAYVYKFKSVAAGTGGTVWLTIAAVMFLLIAGVHVAVNLIHSQPDKWTALADNPWSVLSDAAYFPRLLHFVLAALGFTALVATWWAVRRATAGEDVEVNSAIARFAWKWVLWTTLIQVVGGFLLLVVLPRRVLLGVLQGGIATLGPLMLAILLAVGLIVMIARVSKPVEKAGAVGGTLAAMVLVLAFMSIVRHEVRELYLSPVSSQYHIRSAPQWGNFILFALLLVAGLATVGYMVRQVLNSRTAGEQAA